MTSSSVLDPPPYSIHTLEDTVITLAAITGCWCSNSHENHVGLHTMVLCDREEREGRRDTEIHRERERGREGLQYSDKELASAE